MKAGDKFTFDIPGLALSPPPGGVVRICVFIDFGTHRITMIDLPIVANLGGEGDETESA